MRSIIVLTLTLTLAAPAGAGTFERARIAPELGVDALTRSVAREQVGRDVFSDPYATVTLGSVDVYPVFPYVESRSFEVVSDPAWNRLVYGEAGRTLKAFDGAGTAFGPLKAPRGMAVDERNRLYLADTGNDRILVFDATTEYGEITLTPAFAIGGLSGPYGVACSDGGTPFQPGDDWLFVADTGRNRIAAYALNGDHATFTDAIGDLGGGPGRFAGPMAITVGRSNGASTSDVYVADAHSRRIIRLQHDAGGFRWGASVPIEADLVTSLDTDQWGNVYASAPRAGLVRKFNRSLTPVADLAGGLVGPRAFHVPFVNVTDHRAGRTERTGQPNALALEQWSDASGMKLWSLGLEVSGVAVTTGPTAEVRFALTDDAAVTLDWLDPASGRTLATRGLGNLEAGPHALPLEGGEGGASVLRVTAASRYAGGPTVIASSRPEAAALPSTVQLLGHAPNPAMAWTRIAFALPANAGHSTLAIYDAGGRRVRSLGTDFAPGRNAVLWDGNDDRGREAAGGVYFYRLEAAGQRLSRKLVLVR